VRPTSCLLVLGLLTASSARGAVVADGAISLNSIGPAFNSDFALSIIQRPPDDYTSGFFDFSPTVPIQITLTGVTANIDEGSDWYLARAGQPFNATTIANGDFDFLVGFPGGDFGTGEVTFSPIGDPGMGVPSDLFDFYIAGATGFGFDSGGVPVREVFGWVRLRSKFENSRFTGVEFVESAVAYSSNGIYIGTRLVVPEPTSFCQVLAPLMCLVGMHWNRSRTKKANRS